MACYDCEDCNLSKQFGGKMDSIKRVITDIEDLVDPDVIKEWHKITGEEEE